MKWVARLLLLAAVPLYGGTVDVTSYQSLYLRHGDTISFDLFTSSYSQNAQTFALPLYPVDLRFALAASPILSGGQFAATISSPDASIILAFDGSLGFVAGYLSGAGFQGAVSTLQGHLHFSPTLSQDLFGSGKARLSLQNQGADLTLGLSPLTLGQTLFVSLSGGALSAGARVGSVSLNGSDGPTLLATTLNLDETPVPEPGSGWFLAGGGALLGGISGMLNQVSRRRHGIDTLPEINRLQSVKRL
jgi:hypothetical protein